MKNLLLIVFGFFIILSSLIFNLHDANKKIDNFFELNKLIEKIAQTNRKFELFANNKIEYKNYDEIQSSIDIVKIYFSDLLDTNRYPQLKNSDLGEDAKELKDTIQKEIKIIEKLKSYNAILNNSIRNIQVIKSKIMHNNFDKIYNTVLTLNYQENNNISKTLTAVKEIKTSNDIEKIFFRHINIVFDYFEKKEQLKKEIKDLNSNNKILLLSETFENYTKSIIEKIRITIIIFIVLLIIAIFLFIYYAYSVLKNKIELAKFKNALDISDNIIICTDRNHKITYVNQGFERTSGYTKEEVLGLTPAILKSGMMGEEFYEELKNTIHSGKKWYGEFINKNKFGKITYEKASITPIKDENGEIIEYLSVKLDITKEKEYQNVLLQQSKMVSMGELLENIAHQWRQPLSIISSLSSGMILQLELSKPTKKELFESFRRIIKTTQNLSTTIDDLRNFFNKNEELVVFELDSTINKIINLIKSKTEYYNITLKTKIDHITLSGKEGELMQAVISILNNSIDAFLLKNIKNKLIEISTKVNNNFVEIYISDNAGGIDENILPKIFELYFTTKHQSQGTGVELYMVYQIITKGFNGEISAKNSSILTNHNEARGVTFTIKIPLKKC